MANRKLVVEVIGDTKSLEKAMGRSAKSVDGFAGKAQSARRSVARSALGITAAFVGPASIAFAAKAAFDEMAEGQKVAAQTRAVLKSTGGAARVTAKHVDRLANRLLKVSGVDDELIKNSENVLLTFRKVRNETGKGNKIFDEATKAILDMSVALGTDLQSATIQVGKALNDPIKGVTALQRVGVSFTKGQRDQIKALVETGETLDAQKLILRELNKEFGGSAEAAGNTLPGKLNILRESLLNLGGTIAEKLSPSITKLVDKLVSWLNKSENQERVMRAVEDAAGALAATFQFLKAVFDRLNQITGSTKRSLELLLAVFIAFKTAKIIGTVAAIATQVGLIGTNAGVATGKVGGLSAALSRAASLASIPILIYLVDKQTGGHISDLNMWIYNHITKPVGKALNALVPGSPFGGSGKPSGGGANTAPRGPRGPNSLVIAGPVTIFGVQNTAELMKALQKEGRRRSGSRRGPNAGASLGIG